MTLEQFKTIWKNAQIAINENEKRFSELDAATGGDGDHGTAIVAALNAIVHAEGDDFKSYITDMAEKLETEASGSTSSLYGAWCEGMADAVAAGKTELDAEELAEMPLADVCQNGLVHILVGKAGLRTALLLWKRA